MSGKRGWGWQTFKPADDNLWGIHDALVEQGQDHAALGVVVLIATVETDLLQPNFKHRASYATTGQHKACTSSQ